MTLTIDVNLHVYYLDKDDTSFWYQKTLFQNNSTYVRNLYPHACYTIQINY